MFFFAFHACGLRVVDVMTLQWGHVNFEKKELRKIMIKTNKRHVIPLTEPALNILHRWQEKRAGCRYVFNLVKDDLDLDDAEALYKARNNATKCINQSLAVVGEQIGLPFTLSMHVARHSFAVFALNKGTFHVGCQSFARSWKYGCHRKSLCQIPARNAVGGSGTSERGFCLSRNSLIIVDGYYKQSLILHLKLI